MNSYIKVTNWVFLMLSGGQGFKSLVSVSRLWIFQVRKSRLLRCRLIRDYSDYSSRKRGLSLKKLEIRLFFM